MNKFSFLALFLLIAVAIADDDGQYRAGKYGDEGRYVPGDEGRYVHDGDKSSSLGGQAGRLISPKFNNYNNQQFVNRFIVDTAASNVNPFSQFPKTNFGKSVAIQSVPVYKSSNPEASSRVLKLENDVDLDSYHYAYETENNIKGEENGRLVNQHTKNEAIQATGFYEYIGPDNVRYRIEYIADENGFQPIGAHLPTPPPIPEEIARILVSVK